MTPSMSSEDAVAKDSVEAAANGSVGETLASSDPATGPAATFSPEVDKYEYPSTIKRNHSKAQQITDMFLEAPQLSANDKGRIALARRRHVDLRTVIILNLPNVLSGDQLLRDFFEFELNLGPVEQVHIARRYTNLRQALAEREMWLFKLEGAWAQYLGNPADPFDQMTDEAGSQRGGEMVPDS